MLKMLAYILVINVVLIAGAFSPTNISAEEVSAKFCAGLGSSMRVSFETDRYQFSGEESFNQFSSNRVVAFATKWTIWRGMPTLREDDLLCYLTAKVGNPFSHIFFNCGTGSSDFVIKGNRVFRDGKLFGASVSNMEEFREISEIAREITYLDIRFVKGDSTLDEAYIKVNLSKFSRLKYLCSSLSWDLLGCFLKECPIEFFQVSERKKAVLQRLDLRITVREFSKNLGISDNVCSIRSYSIGDEEDEVPLSFPNIRFLSVSDNSVLELVKQGCFPSLEGLIVDATEYLDNFSEHLKKLPKLRILCADLHLLYEEPVVVPQILLKNRQLEHLHLYINGREFSEGSKFATKKLTSLSTSTLADLESLEKNFDLTNIQVLRLSSISDFSKLSKLKKLREVRVDTLRNPIGDISNISLTRLCVLNAKLNLGDIQKLLKTTANGVLTISYLDIAEGEMLEPVNYKASPKEVRVLGFNGSDESVCSLLGMLQGCEELLFINRGHVAFEVREKMRDIACCKAYSCDEEVFVRDSGVLYNPPEDERYFGSHISNIVSDGDLDVFYNWIFWQPDFFFRGFQSAEEEN